VETIQNTIATNESAINFDSYFNNPNILYSQNCEQGFI